VAFFNPSRPSYVADPYPALHRLREEAPVFYSAEHDAWIVTSYEACVQVLQDYEVYSSAVTEAPGRLGDRVRRVKHASVLGTAPRIGQQDPPAHSRLRGVVARAFTPRHVEAMRPAIEAHVASLIDVIAGLEGGRPVEAMRALCEPLPAAVVSAQLGAPEEDRARVLGWARALMQVEGADLSPERRALAVEARDGLLGYLGRVAAGETGDPDSLIASLARAGAGEERLDLGELLALVIDLSLAGNDNTSNLVGNGILALAAHPEQQALLRERPDLLPAAVDEVLRYDAPQQAAVRFVAAGAGEVTLGGERLEPGDVVIVMLGAANRDSAAFPDPDRFDITREGPRHLAFGLGPHFCIGAPLARMVGAAAFEALLARFEVVRLAGDIPVRHAPDWMARSARVIPLDTAPLLDRWGAPGTLEA